MSIWGYLIAVQFFLGVNQVFEAGVDSAVEFLLLSLLKSLKLLGVALGNDFNRDLGGGGGTLEGKPSRMIIRHS